MYFGNSGLSKTSLAKSLKSAVSQYPSTTKMVNEPKHCSNLNEGTFTIVFDHCESN